VMAEGPVEKTLPTVTRAEWKKNGVVKTLEDDLKDLASFQRKVLALKRKIKARRKAALDEVRKKV